MLYKRDGRTWWYRFTFDGQRVQRSANTHDKEEAKANEAECRLQLAQGDATILRKKNIPTPAWIASTSMRWTATRTAAGAKHPDMGPLSPASVNRELACLRRLLRVAKKWKKILDVPQIKMLPGERTVTSFSITPCSKPTNRSAATIVRRRCAHSGNRITRRRSRAAHLARRPVDPGH